MEIKVCTTHEWTEQEWSSFIVSFNIVFSRQYSEEFFRKKYLSSCDHCSYHALLLNDDGEVVGNCSIVPFLYYQGSTVFKNGLGADVFIREEYRTDPLMLRRMYKKLVKLLVDNSVVAVMAVPNAMAYPYWKNVVKWKDVGYLRYWALPVRVGNVCHKYHFLNAFSRIYCSLVLGVSAIFSFLGGKQRQFKYSIVESEDFIQERFGEDYECVQDGAIKNYFKIVDEDGVRTAYLIYSRENGVLSFRSLYKGVSYIIRQHKVDLVLYIGPLSFQQSLFWQIPHKIEPKLLPLTCDLLQNKQGHEYFDMLVFSNWDFGLLNYDVR